MKTFTLTCELWLPQSPDEVFPFFADASNLERLTPPSLRFRDSHAAADRDVGGHAHRLPHPVCAASPCAGKAKLQYGSRTYRFVDEQRRGPYRLWVHEHVFIPREGTSQDGGTLAKRHRAIRRARRGNRAAPRHRLRTPAHLRLPQRRPQRLLRGLMLHGLFSYTY